MKMPPYLIGGALLFWGWATGHFLLGMLLALVLEGGRWANWHWELTERDKRQKGQPIYAFVSGLTLARTFRQTRSCRVNCALNIRGQCITS
jgi:hypothetical protein